MKLRNKKTGAIYKIEDIDLGNNEDGIWVGMTKYTTKYTSLAELNEEWEDYEDELLYVISAEHKSGYQCVLKEDYPEICKVAKELGIGFETEKECREAVEKLKAWKRLKDKGFRFTGWEDLETLDIEDSLLINRDVVDGACVVGFRMNNYENCIGDLDLLLGGKEC